MIPAAILEIVTKAVHPSRRYRVDPDADLVADLRLCALDRVTVACAVEEHYNSIMPDAEYERWAIVADIIASVERRAKEAA